MFDSRSRFPLVAAALLFSGLVACSSAAPTNRGGTGGDGEEETGGASGSTGGKTGGTGGKATGGASGSTGGASGSTGGASGSTGGTGGSTGGAGGSTGGAGGSTGGAGGGGGTGGAGGGGGAVLACWPNPKVIKICHQLENACENCGPTKAVACQNGKYPKVCACFELINKAYKGMATDADCEKYAMENDCTVDNVATTGNLCGSLDCSNPACSARIGSRSCLDAQGWGDSSQCKAYYDKCPCK